MSHAPQSSRADAPDYARTAPVRLDAAWQAHRFAEILNAGDVAACSDFRVTVEDALTAGDRVVGCYTHTGVHTGAFLGYAPTGRPVTMRSIDVWRVGPDGRFGEHWDELNTLEFFQQIGAASVAAPAAGEATHA